MHKQGNAVPDVMRAILEAKTIAVQTPVNLAESGSCIMLLKMVGRTAEPSGQE